MLSQKTAPAAATYALEVTGKGIAEVEVAKSDIPPRTPINIAFLGNESHEQRINAAKVIRSCGFDPVPIISSRRLRSEQDRDQLLQSLVAEASPGRFIFVGGDPSEPAGPFQDSIALLKSGVLDLHAIRHVGIVAYPEGHPKIGSGALWDALKWKHRFLVESGCSIEITTQFGFDTDAAIRWIDRLREEGIEAPVRIGLPGPADVGKLLRFAKQFGVVTSAALARRYGLSLASLARKSVADRYWADLSEKLSHRDFGDVRYHLYPFGGIQEGVRWMNNRLSAAPMADRSE